MRRLTLILLLGAWIALLPSLGFPNAWDDVMYEVCGVLIVVLAFFVRRQYSSHLQEPPKETRPFFKTYTERRPIAVDTAVNSSNYREKESSHQHKRV